jgi:hypothetical protein
VLQGSLATPFQAFPRSCLPPFSFEIDECVISSLRAFLSRTRLGGLPTIWSNCLAGWWLGGGGNAGNLPFLLAGATLLCLGGVFSNDAFDAEFDREHHPARPIPSGRVSWKTVWRTGLACLALGALSWFWIGTLTGGLGLALVFCIVLFDSVHRSIAFSPLLLGLCRLLLYVAASSVGAAGVTGWSVWCGLALAAYVAGHAHFVWHARTHGRVPYTLAFALACPIVLALIMDANGARQSGLLLSAVLGLWILRCLRPALWSPEPDLEFASSGLMAGIVFVDWLAVADAPRLLSFAFLALFGLALLFLRLAPVD